MDLTITSFFFHQGIYSSVHLSAFYDEVHSATPKPVANIAADNNDALNLHYKCEPPGRYPVQGVYSLLRREQHSLEAPGPLDPSARYSALSEIDTRSPKRTSHLQVPQITVSLPVPLSRPSADTESSAVARTSGSLPSTTNATKDTSYTPAMFELQNIGEEERQSGKEEAASLECHSLDGSESHYLVARNSGVRYFPGGSKEGGDENSTSLDGLIPADYEQFYSTANVQSSESEEEALDKKRELGLQITSPPDSIYNNVGRSCHSRHSTAIADASYEGQLVKEGVIKAKRPASSAMVEHHHLHQMSNQCKTTFTPQDA